MLIGFVFIFFHLNINSFDILPDMVGYILVFYGTRTLLSHVHNDQFVYVKFSSLLLILLSGLDFFIQHSVLLNGVINSTQFSGRMFSLLFAAVNMSLLAYCVYHLCRGIEQEARRIENIQIASSANRTCMFFLSYLIVTFIFTAAGILFTINSSEVAQLNGNEGTLLFLLLFLYMIGVIAQLFILLYKSEKAFTTVRTDKS